MSTNVYIRPLEKQDALVSYHWRNDADLWKFTGGRPDKLITAAIEEEWIAKVLQNENEKRFAICTKDADQYIGNIQLTNIAGGKAQYHIFIGEKSYWGKGLAKEASYLILKFAFESLNLETVTLEVNKDNVSAVKLYNNLGFKVNSNPASAENFLAMSIARADFQSAETAV